MKKIAIIVDNTPSDGGTFQYNQAIVDAFHDLPEKEFQKIIFYTNDFWKEYLNTFPYTFIELKLTSRLKKILKLITLFKLPIGIRKAILYILSPHTARHLNNRKIDLLIFPSQDNISLFITSAKVNIIHDLMHRYESHFPEVSSGGRIKYRDILFKAFCNESKAIIVDSKVGSIHVQETYHIDKNKIYELPYIPPPHILSQKSLHDDFEKKYANLPAFFLFYPSQFWPHKNHKNLLLAISILLNKGIEVYLVFAGKMSYEYDNLVELIEDLNLKKYITFLGFVPNEYLKEIYLRAKGLIMPTFFGPTNIPPLEAIFLDCPAAVSKIYGMEEQLGNASLYFDPAKPESIAEAIQILWEDEEKRKELIENGKNLKQHWNRNLFNKRFQNIIEVVLLSKTI